MPGCSFPCGPLPLREEGQEQRGPGVPFWSPGSRHWYLTSPFSTVLPEMPASPTSLLHSHSEGRVRRKRLRTQERMPARKGWRVSSFCLDHDLALGCSNSPGGWLIGIGLLLQRPGGHGNPLQYSGLESPMDRGAWRATVHRVAESRTRLKWLTGHSQGPLWPHVACLMASFQLIYCFGILDTKQQAAGFCWTLFLSIGV